MFVFTNHIYILQGTYYEITYLHLKIPETRFSKFSTLVVQNNFAYNISLIIVYE